MQRIRIGLTGLAFVFLLVLLGTVVSRSSREPGAIPNSASAANIAEPSDPLSDLGVAPGPSAESNHSGADSSTK